MDVQSSASWEGQTPKESWPTYRVCPCCGSPLSPSSTALLCAQCRESFPVVRGVPILINDRNSVFQRSDFKVIEAHHFFEKGFRKFFFSVMPELARNIHAAENYKLLWPALRKLSGKPRVLVIGAGAQVGPLRRSPGAEGIEFVGTDVWFGPDVEYICDAHDLPFAGGTFDGVLIQAVLEHVADPQRCAGEVARVLKTNGMVYAESPFIHPAHALPYDYHRFTHIAHRRLFRGFEEVASGVAGGPGQALAHCWQAYLLSFSTSRPIRAILYAFARYSSFWLKYLDSWLGRQPEAIYAASGLYFLGRKTDRNLTEREIISLFARKHAERAVEHEG